MAKRRKPLNDQQRRFALEYVRNGGNAGRAYVAAGYVARGDSARKSARRLLTNVAVSALVAKHQERFAAKIETSAENVLRELARISFADPRQLMTWGPKGVTLKDSRRIGPDAAAAVESVSQTTTKDGGSIKLKLHSKPAALAKLGESLGLFEQKPPLEALLAFLPKPLADALRPHLAVPVPGGGPAPGGKPARPDEPPGPGDVRPPTPDGEAGHADGSAHA